MNTRTISILFGIIFIGVGLLGFVPNPVVSENGIFAVNTMHNLVHVLTGLALLIAIFKFPGFESRILKITGLAYVLVTIIGFLTSGNMLLGLIHINVADRWLHLALAVVIFAAGYLPQRRIEQIATTQRIVR